MRFASSRLLALAAVMLAASLLAGCKGAAGTTDIKTLMDDPTRFDKQTVRVAGEVTRSLGVLGYGAYELDDKTGTIPIVTESGGAPRTGAKVGVEGEFRAGFTLGATSGAAIVEKRRFTP